METKWTDKIKQGMKLIIEGCKENPDWQKCQFCPFDTFCIAICDYDNNFSTPSNWERESLDFMKKRG